MRHTDADQRQRSDTPPLDMLDRAMIRGGVKASALECLLSSAILAVAIGFQSICISWIGVIVFLVMLRSDMRVARWRNWVHAQNLELVRLHMKQEQDGHNATKHVEAGCQCMAVSDLSGDENGRPRMVTRAPCKRVTW